MADFNIVAVDDLPSSATTVTSDVVAVTSSVTILLANASRLGATVYNDSNKAMFLKHGTGATTSSYTVRVPKQWVYELPTPLVYTGVIEAVWDTGAVGSAKVTELA